MKTATLPEARKRARISCGIRSRAKQPPGVKIKNVLATIDFSEHSLEALQVGSEIVKRFGADLHLVHVYVPDFPLTTMTAMPLVLPPAQVAQGIRGRLKDVLKQRGIELKRGNTHAIAGRAYVEICELARREKIDLIVLATRGNTGLKHLVLGSTAERVVRYSPCPVLVVHPRTGQEKGQLRFNRVLVPTDFSAASLRGLDYAKGLAQKFGSKLILLNSLALRYYITNDEYARFDLPWLMQQEEKASRRQMKELIESTDWEGIEVQPSLQIGHAGQQICTRAAEEKADLIVTTTHGTTGFKHMLVGSTAEYVVRHAPVPVLVVPSHDRPQLKSAREERK